MKYAMEHKVTRDLICETASPIETLCYFAGYLIAHVPDRQQSLEETMWCMVEIPRRKAPRRFRPTHRQNRISVNAVCDGLGMLSAPVSMYGATGCGGGSISGLEEVT